MLGKELVHDTSLSKIERLYIRVFGIPVHGLRNRARRILPLVTKRGYINILDHGCGSFGSFTFEIARILPDSTVIGIDIIFQNEFFHSKNSILAEIAGLKNCRFESPLFFDITDKTAQEQYDLVLSIDVLEHIHDDSKTLNFYHSVLLPGGDLILHVPGYYRRWFLFGWKVNFDVEGHFRPGYTMENIVSKVKDAGFVIIEHYYTYGWLETITNNISYLITGARMKRKYLYALIFPILLIISWFGRNSKPDRGAGILLKVRKQ
ncbi:class I SAM-dependent methyltransferase [Candidatus Latescibacterota bacterium]